MASDPAFRRPNVGVSRRTWIVQSLAAGVALAACSAAQGNSAEALDPRVPDLLKAAPSVDMHTHAAGAQAALRPTYNVAAQMRAGGLTALCLCHEGDGPARLQQSADGRIRATREPQPGEYYAWTMRRLKVIDEFIADLGMKRVLTPSDLAEAKATDQPAVIGTIEGCNFVEDRLERLEEVYAKGVRHLQIVHNAISNLGDVQTEDPVVDGLSALGAAVVRECNRLGIVVDVAHGTFKMTAGAAQAGSTPLVLSHTSLVKAPRQYSRAISAEHAKLIADTGGVIGVWPNRGFFKTPQAYAEGLARMADIAGVDHVGIGTDTGGLPAGSAFSDYSELPVVAHSLLKQGFSPAEASQILGGNYVRVFAQVAAARKA